MEYENTTDELSQDQALGSQGQQESGSTSGTDEYITIGGEQVPVTEVTQWREAHKGLTQKFQSVAEERRALEAEKQSYEQFKAYQEMYNDPEGRLQLARQLAQEAGIWEPGDVEDDVYDADPRVSGLIAQNRALVGELTGIKKMLEPLAQSHAQQQAQASAVSMAKATFGHDVSWPEMQAAMGATGIDNPVGAYAAWQYQQNQGVINQARAKATPPPSPNGRSANVLKVTHETKAEDLLRAMDSGMTIE